MRAHLKAAEAPGGLQGVTPPGSPLGGYGHGAPTPQQAVPALGGRGEALRSPGGILEGAVGVQGVGGGVLATPPYPPLLLGCKGLLAGTMRVRADDEQLVFQLVLCVSMVATKIWGSWICAAGAVLVLTPVRTQRLVNMVPNYAVITNVRIKCHRKTRRKMGLGRIYAGSYCR